MTSRTFQARQSYRRGAFYAGMAGLVAAAILCAVLFAVLGPRAEPAVPWLMAGAAIGFLVATIVSMVPRPVRVLVDGGTIGASFRKRRLRVALSRVEIGRWVLAGVDTPCGLAVHIDGPDGRLIVGGVGHAGEGYTLHARPVRTVDCHLPSSDFDALVAGLGITPSADRDGPLVVELTLSSQTFKGALATLRPWLGTIAAVSLFGITLGVTGLGDRIQAIPYGPWALSAVTLIMLVTGLILTARRGSRVRLPELELRASPESLVLGRPGGAEVASARWSGVTAVRCHYKSTSRVGTYTFPVLELTIGSAPPLVIASVDATQAWSGETRRRFWSPPYLLGAPMWRRLVNKLRARGRL